MKRNEEGEKRTKKRQSLSAGQKSLRRGVSSTLQAARAARGESIDTSRDAEPRKGPDTDLLRTLVTMQSAELRRIRSELNEAYGALRNLQQQQQQQAAP